VHAAVILWQKSRGRLLLISERSQFFEFTRKMGQMEAVFEPKAPVAKPPSPKADLGV